MGGGGGKVRQIAAFWRTGSFLRAKYESQRCPFSSSPLLRIKTPKLDFWPVSPQISILAEEEFFKRNLFYGEFLIR